MYPSNRVKRRPAPYEVELDEGRRILDLYKYGKMHLCCVPPSANPQISLPHLHPHPSTAEDASQIMQNKSEFMTPRAAMYLHAIKISSSREDF